MCACVYGGGGGGGGGGLQVFPAISVIIALVIHTILHNYEMISDILFLFGFLQDFRKQQRELWTSHIYSFLFRTRGIQTLCWKRRPRLLIITQTYPSFSSSPLSPLSPPSAFHLRYRSIRSTRHAFFLAFLMNRCFRSSFALGRCGE